MFIENPWDIMLEAVNEFEMIYILDTNICVYVIN